jgi:acyl-CoA synthetase (AMP-forming)/AMP-acid ligase II
VAELFAASVMRRPDAVALIQGVGAGRRAISLAELDAWSREIAATLAAAPVSRGEAVLFFAAPSIELYASVIAVLRLGAVAMFIEPSAGTSMIDHACAMHAPRAFIGTPKAQLLRLVSRAMRAIPRKYVTHGWAPGATSLARRGDAASGDASIARMTEDEPALLTFTSGSTGRPKGAVRTHGILRAQLAALSASVAASEGTRELVSLPIVVLLNLANGAETILPDANLRRPASIDPIPVLRQLAAERATRITASPAFLERLVEGDASRADARPTMQEIVTGGGPVFPDIVRRLVATWPTARVTSVYGSTEAEPIAHTTSDERSVEDLAAMRSGAGLLAGAPDPSVRLAIIAARRGSPIAPMRAADLEALTRPTSVPGEIVVTGAHVVRGYLGGIGDEETKFSVDGAVWHRTGDLGYLDERGRLWLLGRADAVIEDSRGTLHPFAVECAAREVLGVRRVAAMAHEGKRLLILESSAERSAAERAAALDALAWARIDEIVTWRKLPMDRRHNSKVDYPSVRKMLARQR